MKKVIALIFIMVSLSACSAAKQHTFRDAGMLTYGQQQEDGTLTVKSQEGLRVLLRDDGVLMWGVKQKK